MKDNSISNLISALELIAMPDDTDHVIADCRFDLSRPLFGSELFRRSHVPGAMYFSLDEHLSAPVSTHGGRHPLPPVASMAEMFSEAGIENDVTSVVAYDDAGGSFAARLWWMLRYLGHRKVRILDGGFPAYIAAGGRVTSELPERKRRVFAPEARSEMLVPSSDVQVIAAEGRLIDARAPERYSGENETIDFKAGRIPGAGNFYWMRNLDVDNRFLPREKLAETYGRFPENPVMYCGSGATACVNVLAMEEAGYRLPGLYAGGWSDWISYVDNPVAAAGMEKDETQNDNNEGNPG